MTLNPSKFMEVKEEFITDSKSTKA